MAFEIEAAGRHRQVGAQAEFRAVGIGKHVSARAQVLADDIEHQAGGLDDGGRDMLATGRGEHGHQALGLGLERIELAGDFGGRGHRI